MGDDSEWLKLPTDEKCQHKLWKARLAGYEEVIKLFQTLDDEKSPEFSKYLGLVKKFVVDNNAIAQEKGLEATLAFVENAAFAGKTAGEVCSGVVTKCLNQRAKTKDLGVAILMAYIEAEKQEIVQEELMKGLTNKQPKIVSVCVTALREALRDFGTKIIGIKPILKQLQVLLEDRDKTVRDETKLLAVEIYRWIGPALKPQLTNLKPVQITELEAEFEKLPSGKPQQTRFLRSQQDLKAKMLERAAAGAEEASADDNADGPATTPDVDPYELLDPVDILSKLPKDFYEKVEEKKWQERRDALEAVQKLAESPKLEQGDYSDLLRALKKVVAKDSNIMLVTTAAKCIALLATGLRKKFGPHSVGCVEVLIEKFREKKVSVVQTLREAVDACYVSTNLEAIGEIAVASLEHKTPSVKAETASFLARCFAQCTPATLPKKILKIYIGPLLKAVNDPAGEVREAAFEALGTAMKVITEKAMMPFLPDVDNLKMAKIKECCEKAVVLGKGGAAKSAADGGAPAATKAAAQKTAAPPAKESAPGAKPSAKKGPESNSSAPSASSGAGKKKPGTGAKGKKPTADAKQETMEAELPDEVVEEKMNALFPGGALAGLDSANWKERLSSVEKMLEVVKGLSREEIPAQAFVRTISKKPGLKETNFQVLKLKVDLISHLALSSSFSKRSAEYCLNDLMEKISDAKNGSNVQDALSNIAEATSLDFIALQVIQFAFEQKNPKNQSESLVWLATAIKQFGFKVTVKPLVQTIGKALAATNPAVRTAAITLLGVMYMYMGAALRVLFESEKPALLQQIDAEFDKVKGEKPPAPTRGAQPSEEVAEDTEDVEEGGSGDAGTNFADLIPRTDISDRITDGLINELDDKNWKVRKEALEKVQAILSDAKFITTNIGQLPEAMKKRLGDSNKILATIALAICQTLATAMGPGLKQHVGAIGGGLISNLGDSKPAIRLQAATALSAWVEQTGLVVFVEAQLFSDHLKLENPMLRTELLGWLAEKLPACKKLPAELQECIPYLFACMEDRNADVRKKAQDALLPFMIHTGYEAMLRHAGKLKPASKDPVVKALEVARQNLPQKPAKTAAPSQPVVKGGGGGSKVKAPVKTADYNNEDDMDDGGSRPSSSAGSKTSVAGGTKGGAKSNGGGTGATAAGNKKGGSGAGNSGAPGKKKGQEEEDLSPPLKVSNGKEQRIKDEKNLKVFKWNFPTPRPEFIEQLRQQMEPTFNRTLMDQLFHADFKFHIKAMDTLIKVCESDPDALVANLDLLLKWVTLRFFDTNTTVLMKALEFLQVTFAVLAARDYYLQEIEAFSFVPYLVNKVGDPKDNIRRDVHNIIQMICKVYPSSKLFSYLLEGLKSKNAKQRTECLEELGCLIMAYGINVCQPSPAAALRLIAQQISDRDNSVRSSALNAVVAAHGILGDNVFKYVGLLSEKDQSMLDERIKRSAKTRPQGGPPPAAPAPMVNARMSPEEKPKTARPATNTTARPMGDVPRAMSAAPRSRGQFHLDFDEIDTTENYMMPQLIEPDLTEILDEPVKLPVTKMRPPSPAMKLLHNSSDAKSAVDLVISQIASSDINTSLQSLHQIDEVLKDAEKCEALHQHVDHLLIACTLQLRVAYTKHMSENEMSREVIRLYRCLLATLISLCKCSGLIREATRDVLKDLISILVTVLLDNRLNDVQDGQEIIRAVNVTVVRIVEQADVTHMMRALIKLLHETVDIETCSVQFLELVMKCLWKMVRMLPTIINDLDLDRLVADINLFLKAFPSYTWKSKPTDMPLRTIKTILHSLAKIKGNRILGHLSLIEPNDHSEVEGYLRKVLRTSVDTEMVSNTNSRNEQLNGNVDNASGQSLSSEGAEPGQKSPRRISRTVHDTLADIFKKIGSKENTREGLNNLYDFKLKHPDADIDPFLKKSSQFFQDYIERGLKSIALEREGKQKPPPNSSSSSSATAVRPSESATSAPAAAAENHPVKASDYSAAEYLEKLNVLRARCGLDNSKLNTDFKILSTDASSSGAKLDAPQVPSLNARNNIQTKLASTDSSNQETPAATETVSNLNLEEIKRRLDKIKTARKD